MIEIRSYSTDTTIVVDSNGKRIYPCRCGEEHTHSREWMEHECFHDTVWKHDEIDGIGYCGQCGKTIMITGGNTILGI